MGKRTKLGKKQKAQENRKNKTRDRLFSWLFGGIIALCVLYRVIFEPTLINGGNRFLYFNAIPMAIGAVFLVYFCFGWIKELAISEDKPHQKIMGYIVIIPCGLVFLYLIVAMPMDIVFFEIDRYVANQNQPQVKHCQTTFFHKKVGTRDSNFIEFEFDGHIESFRVNAATIAPLVDQNPRDYQFDLKIRKGILGTYLVDYWNVVKKSQNP